MDSDEALVGIVLLIYVGTLTGLVLNSGKAAVRTMILNLFILAIYSAYFGMQYYFWGEPGSALVWWFYYIVFILVHWIFNASMLIIRLVRKETPKENTLID